MDLCSDRRDHNDHQSSSTIPEIKKRSKGGFITMPFIIANASLEYVASQGLLANITFYLLNEYHMKVITIQNLIFYWYSAINFLPIVGAMVADLYLGSFLVIGLGSIFSTLGSSLLWLTAMIPGARPPPCNIPLSVSALCTSPTPGQYGILVSSLVLIAIGAGGVRACSVSFGANQVDNPDNPNNTRVLETFFNWYYMSTSISVLIAITGIVYLQDHIGWKVGLGVPAILMALSVLVFFLSSPFYIKRKVDNNAFKEVAQVIVVAFKNRKVAYPVGDNLAGYYQNNKGSDILVPTNKLRFLNKACIIKSPEDVNAVNPWKLCTVEQVEDLKSFIKIIPLWSTGIMLGINLTQSIPLLQAQSMDRHLTKSFEIPAGSFVTFLMISLILWLSLYDRAFIPLASRIRGKPVRLSPKVKMAIGISFCCMAMLVAGFVEHVRRRRAIQQGLLNNPGGLVPMSALWLVPQYVLNGIAEAFSVTSQTEFYYSQLPKSMSSVASGLYGLGMAVGSLLASVVLNSVDNYTKDANGESWVSSNINKGRYDKYYWLLAIMTLFNLFYFTLCCWFYGPTNENDQSKVLAEEDGKLPQQKNVHL